MPEPVIQNPKIDPVSVPQGGPEGSPVPMPEASGGAQDVEQFIQPPPHETEPAVSAEVNQFVQVKREVAPDETAQQVGVTNSIPPVGKGYVPPAWQTVQEAREVRDATKPNKSMAWIATEAIKRFNIRNFLGSKKEVSKS